MARFVSAEFEEYFGGDATGPPRKHNILVRAVFLCAEAVVTLADLPW
jgi:hypothetical protein